jgi:sarcosine oxidase
MRVTVVGAGAWGLPTGAELARRGHDVTLVDQYGIGSALGSSSGPTRIWRLAHPDSARVRLAVRAVAAWQRLEVIANQSLLLRPGLLWRGAQSMDVATALFQAGVAATLIEPADVDRFFPGLRPNAEPAVWSPDGGPVLAAAALATQEISFRSAGGRFCGGRATALEVNNASVTVVVGDDRIDSDVLVIAPGTGAGFLLPQLGIDIQFRPVLMQVCYFDGPEAESLPCLIETEGAAALGAYAMATPGRGYKMGIELPVREFAQDDANRTPDLGIAAQVSARIARDLPRLDPVVRGIDVCSWTESPDLRFVIDRICDGRVVIAAGDSGEGFKFSALFGELLADLAEGRELDPELSDFDLARFAGRH